MYLGKQLFFITLFTISISAHCQIIKQAAFGQPTLKEKNLSIYEKEPNTNAVVLYEKGEDKIDLFNNRIKLQRKVHKRIKVFNASKFEGTEIFIPLYNSNGSLEKITELAAVTINGDTPTYVTEDAIFKTRESDNWSVKKFTFPNVKDGSILEYTYTIESPYLASMDGWTFQEDIPKIYSEYSTSSPGNYRYNKIIIGTLKLDYDNAKIVKGCIALPGFDSPADCEYSIYIMKDIPSFKEEPYMLSKKNYISKIKYELREIYRFDGGKENFAKTWKDVDKEFKSDKDMGRQAKYTGFFEDILPKDVLAIKDDIERAKAVYYFIQNHYSWNGKYRIFNNIRVKDAFKRGSGNNTEINLSLVNALKAANIDTKIALLSTRKNGLATQINPVMADFNHTIAFVTIGAQTYLLDATDKFQPFGQLPFMDLNRKVRVFDFKKGSYWLPVMPSNKNVYYINSQVKIDEIGDFQGVVNGYYTGHIASKIREDLSKTNNINYLREKEEQLAIAEASDLIIENKKNLEAPLKESYHIVLETEEVGNKIYFNPFFFETYFTQNPFTQNKRNYPLDFGYPITNNYLVTIDLSNHYKVAQLPENKKVQLNGGVDGECSIIYAQDGDKVNVRLNFKLNQFMFDSEDYKNLKSFFEMLINLQTQEFIVLEKA